MSDRCDLDRLEALVFGELEPVEAERVRAHAQACATCKDELAWLRAERAAMHERAAADEPLPASLWSGVEAAIAAEAQPAAERAPEVPRALPPVDELAARRQRRAPRWIGVGAAAVAAAAAALLLLSRPDQPGAPPSEPVTAEGPADAGGSDNGGDAELDEARRAIAEAERAHVNAIDSLRVAYQARRDQLDPQVARVYDQRFEAAAELIASAEETAGDDIEARWLLLDAYAAHRRSLQGVLQEIEE